MNETIRELFKDELAAGRAEVRAKEREGFITNLLRAGKFAFTEIATCAGTSLSRVQDIANSLGIHES